MHTTLDLYTPVFNQAVALNARSLIIFMVLAFAFVPAIVFHRNRRPLIAHALFSLHLYAFMLLLFSVANAVPALDLRFGGTGFASEPLDRVLSLGLLVACAAYLYIATGAVYGAKGPLRLFKVVALTIGMAAIVLGYRFVLLLITLYST
jgi:hypothetical protein